MTGHGVEGRAISSSLLMLKQPRSLSVILRCPPKAGLEGWMAPLLQHAAGAAAGPSPADVGLARHQFL